MNVTRGRKRTPRLAERAGGALRYCRHGITRFSRAEEMTKTRGYESDDIRIRYHADRCIHAARCVDGLPRVFDRDRRPWVDPSAASADEVAAVVESCPTGALEYERLDGGGAEAPPSRTTLRLEPDGPIYGHGRIEIRDSEVGDVAGVWRIALCRCGASRNKPFCDGSHSGSGFRDAGQVGEARPRPISAETPADLGVRPLRDGPLLLDGRFVLRDVDGTEWEGGGGALCRCGGSSSKPFCDGTHRRIGFRSDDPQGPD